jgi:hypothetical protein
MSKLTNVKYDPALIGSWSISIKHSDGSVERLEGHADPSDEPTPVGTTPDGQPKGVASLPQGGE